jgi:hypothetical protein
VEKRAALEEATTWKERNSPQVLQGRKDTEEWQKYAKTSHLSMFVGKNMNMMQIQRRQTSL